jgi:iron complex transport system substrate-binding protein
MGAKGALKPDLVVLGIGQAKPPNEIVRQLETGGVPVMVTDFFINPFDNTLPSVRMLGKAIGRPERAKSFADFYRSHMTRISGRLAQAKPSRPKILFETHAGMAECCFAPGRGSINRFVEVAGGHNIGADVLPGPAGQLSAEYILAQDPSIYIATGGSHLEKRGGLVIGPGYTAMMVKERLEKLIARPTVSGIAAIRDGQVHGIFHNLITTPLNILATENLAKWAHPRLFNDLDPSQTMKELNEHFLAVPLEGIYWIDLSPAKRP